MRRAKTPCIGVCSTGIGDTVCRGCKRFAHEIIQWNALDDEVRWQVLARLDALLAQVIARWLVIENPKLLQAQLKAQQVVFDESRAASAWVLALLKAGASQIQDLAVWGLARTPQALELGLVAIKNAIDDEFYTLSCAHYERYFQRAPLEQPSA